MKHILILAHGASGTTTIYDHLLNNKHVYRGNLAKEPLNNKEENTRWYEEYIVPLMAEAENKKLVIHISPKKAKRIGLTITSVVDKMSDKFDFIHIIRRNDLAREVSIAGKRHNKRLQKIKDAESQYNINLDVTLDNMLTLPNKHYYKSIHKVYIANDEIRQACKPYNYYHVDYEYDINDKGPMEVVLQISKDFGFYDSYTYTPYYTNYNSCKNKWSSLKIKDKVRNYQYVANILKGTEYEWMVYE